MNWNLPGWKYQPDKCACDDDFIDWLETTEANGPVFHMGTGLHHNVGKWCTDHNIYCIGITASEEEFNSVNGYVSNNYQLILGDIYNIEHVTTPKFNVMSLFHIGELVELFGDINEYAVIRMIDRVKIGGKVLFYRGSSAWDRVEPVVKSFVTRGLIAPYAVSKSLEIYQVLDD